MASHFPHHARSPTLQVNIKNLIDDVQCYQTVRELRWPDGIACPSCQSTQIIKRGFDDTELARQRYECTDCHTRFDDQIAQELALNGSDVQQMTAQLREGI